VSADYSIVQLANGAFSLRSRAYGETFHPVIGPAAEAEALYVKQLRLAERIECSSREGEEFVVWDVGLGAAANPLTLLKAASHLRAKLRIISFDSTDEPLRFAAEHAGELDYVRGFEPQISELLRTSHAAFELGGSLSVQWDFHRADFPEFLKSESATPLPKPHAVFYDAFSPATNPSMWTLGVFSDLFNLLDPERPCSMPTYSRSTLLRVTLLLAGFFVGAGHATGEKEETTIAANSLKLIQEPLGLNWLGRAQRSRSAEPILAPPYRQAPLTKETLERLQAHPQFAPHKS
jgi:tRNA U34 5-methylaminomethyl-2-thiouridine-forming methyltransferase MnmC